MKSASLSAVVDRRQERVEVIVYSEIESKKAAVEKAIRKQAACKSRAKISSAGRESAGRSSKHAC